MELEEICKRNADLSIKSPLFIIISDDKERQTKKPFLRKLNLKTAEFMVEHLRDFQKSSLLLKTTNFSSLKRRVIHYLEKFSKKSTKSSDDVATSTTEIENGSMRHSH